MQARAEIIAKAKAKTKMTAFVAGAVIAPTTLKIANAFGLSKTTAGTYLRELERDGIIHRNELTSGSQRRSRALPSIWMPGKGAAYIPEADRLDPLMVMHQASVRKYPVHHVRDPLVAALFGAAVHS